MVYFVRIPGGFIKIGITADFPTRKASLSTQYGPVSLLASMPGSEPEERALHERFAAARVRRSEIFVPSPELMEFIAGLPESPIERKLKPKVRLVVEIDPEIVRRLQHDRADTSRPVNHIVEEVLARHYDALPPVVSG